MNTKNLDDQDRPYKVVKYTLSRFMKNNNITSWKKLTLENVETFVIYYVKNKEKQCLGKNNTLKGYVIKRFLYYLFRVIEAETGNPLPKILTSRVKRTTHRYAKPILAKYPQKDFHC